jgi:uncharacterized protein (TIGR02588 family)
MGLAMTLAALGYSLWEGVTHQAGPPELTAEAGAVIATPGGFVTPVTVRNAGDETAASVEVRGELLSPGRPPEERRVTFAYVPGGGKATGGLVFAHDPRVGRLTLSIEGYEEP